MLGATTRSTMHSKPLVGCQSRGSASAASASCLVPRPMKPRPEPRIGSAKNSLVTMVAWWPRCCSAMPSSIRGNTSPALPSVGRRTCRPPRVCVSDSIAPPCLEPAAVSSLNIPHPTLAASGPDSPCTAHARSAGTPARLGCRGRDCLAPKAPGSGWQYHDGSSGNLAYESCPLISAHSHRRTARLRPNAPETAFEEINFQVPRIGATLVSPGIPPPPRSDSVETPPCDDPPGSSATLLPAIPTPPALRNRASSGSEYWAIRTTPATRPRDGTRTQQQLARELSRTAGMPSPRGCPPLPARQPGLAGAHGAAGRLREGQLTTKGGVYTDCSLWRKGSFARSGNAPVTASMPSSSGPNSGGKPAAASTSIPPKPAAT